MRPRTIRSKHAFHPTWLGLGLALLFLAPTICFASGRSNVILRESVSASHRAELISKLATITGWRDMKFANDGSLDVGQRVETSGSKAARQLLDAAVKGNKVLIIEDASSRFDVAFCRVVQGRWVGPKDRPEQAYVVLVDFADFQRVTGDNEARASFDVGWGFLHEVDHVVNDSEDPQVSAEATGECEDHINQMRSEVGLPVRAGYFFSTWPSRTDPTFVTRLVRLSFVRRDVASHKVKRYWLVWDAAVVGGSTEQNQTALIQAKK